jgi:hypothetical protein
MPRSHNDSSSRTTTRGAGFGGARSLVFIVLGALVACSEILKQEAPSRVPAELLNDPGFAQLRVRSAVGDFECALAHYIIATARVGDEFADAQLGEAGWDYDRRTIDPVRGGPYATVSCNAGTLIPGYYVPLSVARFQADEILRLLEGWTDEQVASRDSLIAVAAAYAGYSLVYMGETMCSSAIDVGPELTPTDLLTEAEARFTRAIEAGTAAAALDVVNLAYIGRARARRGLGNLTGARTDAELVPTGFVYNATYSSAVFRRENRVFTQLFRDNASTVQDPFRDLMTEGVADPRVVVMDGGQIGHDNTTPVFLTTKYPAIDSPIPIARYEEAQLIIAEALIAAGSPGSAVTIIDARRSQLGIPAYSGPTDAVSVQNLLIEERKRELFLEGHRLADIIRYDLPLDPAPGTPFPKGSQFGTQVCFPLPDVERLNNPNIGDS